MEHEVNGCIQDFAKLVSMGIDEKNHRYKESIRKNEADPQNIIFSERIKEREIAKKNLISLVEKYQTKIKFADLTIESLLGKGSFGTVNKVNKIIFKILHFKLIT
jgi:hypothetical protein